MWLLEFPCGRRASLPEQTSPSPSPSPTAESVVDALPAEEAVSSVPEKRRRRMTRGATSSTWRPSLLSISEDGASGATPTQMPPVKSAAAAMNSGGSRKVKEKVKPKPKPAGKVVPRAGKDEYYQHYGVVPTFAPAAFLF